MVKVKLNGLTSLVNGVGDVVVAAKGGGTAAGVGDIAAVLKYRFYSFGDDLPDPGGLALLATMRMPTGIARISGVSVFTARWCSDFPAGKGGSGRMPMADTSSERRCGCGGELCEERPRSPQGIRFSMRVAWSTKPRRSSLIVDLLGRHILGGGKVGFQTTVPPPNASGVTSFESAVALPEGIQKITLVPGLKANLKGNLLLSLNVLSALKDTGLHATFIPVVGLDLTF